jgi:hypothetical protein
VTADTPIIDAAVRAGCNQGCNYPDCEPACHAHRLRIERSLHSALPWDVRCATDRVAALILELYPEKFAP